jgi:hypothetical protein
MFHCLMKIEVILLFLVKFTLLTQIDKNFKIIIYLLSVAEF